MQHLLRPAAIALLSPGLLTAQHPSGHTTRDSLSVMAIAIGTTVSPALNGRARSEVMLTQPMVALRGARFGSALQYVGMLNLERWTMPDGEPVAGIWGEGFIDRRHPHTVVHEAMLTGNLTVGTSRISMSGGKGFVPFGTDDPMVRPFVKYPANHHHSQIMERVVLVAAARIGARVAVEVAAFNGDEPLSPTAAPQWNRFGDSKGARLTLWPRGNLEVQGSVASVRSPDFVRAEGLDHRKLNVSIRFTPAGSSPRYLLAEWARTDERTSERSVVAYGTALAEALIGVREWSLAARVERTTRPEDERLLDPFRTTRPPNHLSLLALTRWHIGTVQLARPLISRRGVHASVFAEVSRASSSPLLSPVFANPRDISGGDAAWHLSAGFRVGGGLMSPSSCGDDDGSPAPQPEPGTVPTLAVLGQGSVTSRYTGEITVGSRYAYSSTWGIRNGNRGNAIFIWDLAAPQPVLVDSVLVADAGTTGDVQVVADANLLVVAVEPSPKGALVLYDLTTPTRPQLIGRYETPNTINGVHTAQVSRVNGRLYAFLCIDPRGADPAKLVIVDITDPRAPVETWVQPLGAPFVHDVFVRDGILLTAEWNDGMAAYDIGGGGRGGTPSAPVLLGRILTVGGSVHNVYWQRDSVSGSRYAFVGEEGPGAIGSSSVGDVHVVDVSSWSAMREVAFFRVSGAGTHNFWVDEPHGMLYAAYYNAGLRALDVRGDLGSCAAAARDAQMRCDLSLAGRVRGVGLASQAAYLWGVDGAGTSVIASDMLGGVWRLALAVR